MRIKIQYRHISYFLIVVTSVFVMSCANMGVPEGGPKDIEPPKIVESTPENYSKNFSGLEIKITFDEFVKLKNINSALVISPPINEKPEIKLKGKSLYLEFTEPFLDSTTYSLNFGNSITDNNEGNVLKNFSYVFSTGDIIDSLSIGGKLINSKTGKAEEDVLIMAYTNLADSAPIKERPLYIARSLEDGSFILNNMKDTVYKIFALSDANSNFLFDQPNESVAFSKNNIKPEVETIITIDTIRIDSLDFDSIVIKSKDYYTPTDIELRLFEEKFSKQYLKSFNRPEKSKLEIAFNEVLEDSIILRPVNFEESQFIVEYVESKDSVMMWITDTSIFSLDSLFVDVEYPKTDSIGQVYIDTLNLKFGYKEKSKPLAEKLKLKIYPKNNSKFDISKIAYLGFDHPIQKIDTSLISLEMIEDSTRTRVLYSLEKDNRDIKKYFVKFDFDEDKKYSISMDDSAFCDFRGIYNDSTFTTFKVRKTESYGSLILSLAGINSKGIVQLLGSKDKVVQELYVSKSGKVTFNLVTPGTYRLKYIDDRNGTREWDTGKYIENLQPEKVFNYKEEIKVRANWEMEIDWNPLTD